jgi:type II secretion system protein F
MARFTYEAKRGPSDTIKGTLIADTRYAAIQKLSQSGYYLVSIQEEVLTSADASTKKAGPFFPRVSLKNLTDFTRQLSDLLESALTLVRALDTLHNQTASRRLKDVIADVRDFCVAGNSLSSALARHPDVFSGLYVSMVRSGETGGALESILRRLADFSEKQLEIQTKIRTALAYPALMAVVGCATIIVLMTFVIPKMTVMFGDLGQALPLPTQILIAASNALRNYWWLMAAAAAAAAASLVKLYATPEGRLSIDGIKFTLPVFGQVARKVEIARFARTLATLLANGVPILESLKVVSETMENAVIRTDLEKAYAAVREGSSLGKALRASRSMPLSVVNMITVGEEGGHLEKALLKVAEAFDRESDEAIKIMMSLLEPVLILALGLAVGFIVISMLLPIFEINFLMR